MIDHAGISTWDFPVSKKFYDAAFAALGGSLVFQVPLEHTGGRHVVGYGRERPVFWVTEGEPSIGRHYAFLARNRAEVEAFHAAAMKYGGRDNGAPGLRPEYHENYYGAFARDPDGNNVEAVCHSPA